MSKILSFKREYVSYGAVLLFGLLLSALAANAATTISSAVLTAGGTITVPAAYSLDTAAAGRLNISTTTATGITIGSTSMTSAIVLGRDFTVPAAYGMDTAAAGILNIGTTTATTINIGRSGQTAALLGDSTVAGTLGVTGATTLASTTATEFKVGQVGTSLTRVVAGYCVTASASIAAATFPASTGNFATTTSTFLSCTPSGGASVLSGTGDRVFVSATSSLPSYVLIQSASSTAGNLISVQVVNTSTSTPVAATIYAFNFFAFQ